MKKRCSIPTIIITILLFCIPKGWSQNSKPILIKVLRNKTIVPVRIDESRTLDILLDTGMTFDGLLIYNPDLIDSIALDNAME